MTSQYTRVQAIHPDWKDGECRKCGKYMEDRIHKSVQRDREVAQTKCPDCNTAYDPLDLNTPVGGPSVPDIAVNQPTESERL